MKPTPTPTANALNQYERRTVPGYAGVRGMATNTATVTVNGNPAWRLDEYFYGGDSADNSLAAIMKQLAITAVYNPPDTNTPDVVTSQTGRVFVAQTPEAFTYDDDGNLTRDGRFTYAWDGENRLIKAETRDDLPASVPRVKVEYAYDHQGRMVWKQISTNAVILSTRTLFWDGYNIVQAITHSQTHTLTNSFLWGLDLSGTLQGAGGVGGLLAEIQDGVPYFAAYDANGNVTDYLSADGTIAAHYEYSPFGEIVVQSGGLADSFTHRFSTKPWCGVTRLSEYEMRKYSPSMGRWLYRDALEEGGGYNLYVFVQNSPCISFDALGNATCVFLYENNVDADKMWKVPPNGKPAAAETELTHSFSRKPKKCNFWGTKRKITDYTPSCTITIRYKQGTVPGFSPPWRKETVYEHEAMHRQYFRLYFETVDALISANVDRCMCTPCFKATSAYIEAFDEWAWIVTKYKNVSWDAAQYKPETPEQLYKEELAEKLKQEESQALDNKNLAFTAMEESCP